jgi:hypothetical protein
MVVTAESFFSSWYFKHTLRIDLLAPLARLSSLVLIFYLLLRVGDLAFRGQLGFVQSGDLLSWIFLLEIGLVAVAAVMLLFERIRVSSAGLGIASSLTVLGMLGYRFNVCVVAFSRPEGVSYFPSWIEIVVTLGIVSAFLLIFIFFVENLRVFPAEDEPEPVDRELPAEPGPNPLTGRLLLPPSLRAVRRYSLAATVGAALAFALLSNVSRTEAQLKRTPVLPPLSIDTVADLGSHGNTPPAVVSNLSPAPVGRFVVDGNRNGRLVIFNHAEHSQRLGGDDSCGACHHLNRPFRWNTPCRDCHRDMYRSTDTFSHSSHVNSLEGNQGCVRCHDPADPVKSRATASSCDSCHLADRGHSLLKLVSEEKTFGIAPSYMAAMHGLCERCHQQMVEDNPTDYEAYLGECRACHRQVDGIYLRQLGPYVSKTPEI